MKNLAILGLFLASFANCDLNQTPKNDISNLLIEQLKPLPLIMPQFQIDVNGQINMRNAFELVQKQISEMNQKMMNQEKQFKKRMNMRREEIKKEIHKEVKGFKFSSPSGNMVWQISIQQPLIGGANHDVWLSQNAQTLIGGDHDNWEKQIQIEPPMLRGDHNNWENQIQIEPPMLGGDHNNWENQIQIEPPMLGGDHDNWEKQIQIEPPILGGDHDKWERHPRGQGQHDKWRGKPKHCKKMKKFSKEGRRHNFPKKFWKEHKQFANNQILPYMIEKLPNFKENSEIISILNKGFKKGQGFNLVVQFKNDQQEHYKLQAFYKPRKNEFLIDRIQLFEAQKDSEQIPQNFQKDVKDVVQIPKQEDMIIPGGNHDPDQSPQFMKLARQWQEKAQKQIKKLPEIQLLGRPQNVNNHINVDLQKIQEGKNKIHEKIINGILDMVKKNDPPQPEQKIVINDIQGQTSQPPKDKLKVQLLLK